ncbi:NADPH:quinone reductase-like Zn-dependent oxidoreductase [Streptomyces sp. LBL]|nr:zinc-binding dehydrogenase [Streptomyces sp. LBL]MDH6628726.1 NADPH:quinone reductase-like Zn-dependent oxidoreductase [Streptomyces sp. LBL]
MERRAAARGLRFAVCGLWVTAEPSAAVLEQITERIETGRLKVTVKGTYPLAEAAAAHRELEKKRTNGKIVLVP